MKQIILTLCCMWMSLVLMGQKGDPVLFTVADKPVHISEFLYIYSKTNRDKADFSKASLEEYLDLYTKFKLKVQRARDLKLDTIPSLKQELEGYRQQLADSYLLDKQVTDRLIKEAYDRSKKDLSISHIMIALRKNPTARDTMLAYKKIMAAKKELDDGGYFMEVAQTHSDDKSVKDNKGNIGYFTAPFPNGLYAFENAAYSLKKGAYSNPIRTQLGYHIIKVDNERSARGEIEVAHVLVRKKTPNAKEQIEAIHQELVNGGNFEAIAKQKSQDKNTASKGGYVGVFGISTYEKAFEDAAFSVANDEGISAPFETQSGWHVIKRISKKPVPEFDKAKTRLKAKIQKDARFELAKEEMVRQIQRENNFTENKNTVSAFASTVGKDFTTFSWKAPGNKSSEKIFSLGDANYTLGDFTDYLGNSGRKRMQYSNGNPIYAVMTMYGDYVSETTLKYEERNLEKKYPDFKALMREYREGILLFEITKQEVWDKASQDTTGLANFYTQNKSKYKWKERAKISQYSITDFSATDKIRKASQNSNPAEVKRKFNKDTEVVMIKELTVERGRNKVLDGMSWEAGRLSPVTPDKATKSFSFIKIEEVLPAGDKKLEDARGYVVADYQDHLEKRWIEELKKAYNVKVNKKTLKNLAKRKS